MAIVGTLPVTLANGTTADASQVMSDLNFIANQVNANATPLTGGSPTLAALTVSGASSLTATVTITDTGAASTGALVVTNTTSNNGGGIQLTGNGSTTPSKFLRARSGLFEIVNSAYTGVPLSLTDAGNLTAAGNITANSDERLKKDWAPLAKDFIEKLAAVESGTFTRIATDERNAGVKAQSLREVLPETVLEGPDGYLSVAYGNAALVAVIALAREVLRLRAILEPAK